MTALTIFRSAKVHSRGPILPMYKHEARAWELTRERHPKHYRREHRSKSNG